MEDEAHVVAARSGQRVAARMHHLRAHHLDGARVCRLQSGQAVQKRRLPRAAGAHDAHHLAGLDAQTYAAQHVGDPTLASAPDAERFLHLTCDDRRAHMLSFEPILGMACQGRASPWSNLLVAKGVSDVSKGRAI